MAKSNLEEAIINAADQFALNIVEALKKATLQELMALQETTVLAPKRRSAAPDVRRKRGRPKKALGTSGDAQETATDTAADAKAAGPRRKATKTSKAKAPRGSAKKATQKTQSSPAKKAQTKASKKAPGGAARTPAKRTTKKAAFNKPAEKTGQ